jgi:hypothetical protein
MIFEDLGDALRAFRAFEREGRSDAKNEDSDQDLGRDG